ncbi:MAG: cupin domain-containing protein [Acidobacteria bacterium]|nr:cupin domain-containing protein [Acidobacteriota bacterium]
MEEEQLNPLLGRKVIHGKNLTVARIRLRKSVVVPTHNHRNEQITLLESGVLRFIIEGEEKIARAGDVIEIPPDAAHSVEALEDSVAVDLFSPVREDWVRGEDSYLRK